MLNPNPNQPAGTACLGYELNVEKLFKANRERVFDCWTQAEHIRKWFRPHPTMETATVVIDLRVGGKYQIGVRVIGETKEQIAHGEYEEIVRPERLVYTWSGECSDDQPSRVKVTFEQHGTGTLLKLHHSGFTSEEAKARHAAGWNGCIASLENELAR